MGIENYVQIDLVDVGFEMVGVTMPNHRQFCVVWYKFNSLCKLDGGHKLIEKVLDLYRDTLRSVVARKMALRTTPRLIFRLADEANATHCSGNALRHKEKVEYLVEAALIEEYQQRSGIEFEAADNETEQKYKNERFHDLLMNKIYGDWRYGEDGKLGKGFKMRNEQKRIGDKWIETFLNKIGSEKKTPAQRKKATLQRRRAKGMRNQQKAKVLNRILSTDPNFVSDDAQGRRLRRADTPMHGLAVGTDIDRKNQRQRQQRIDIIVPSKHRAMADMSGRADKGQSGMMTHDQDLDLVGFVE